jgi:hypothetical protein
VFGTIAYRDKKVVGVFVRFFVHILRINEPHQSTRFSTGGIIYGYEGVREAFKTGRGRIVMRAKLVLKK